MLQTRARPLGIDVIVGDHHTFAFDQPVFGVFLQYLPVKARFMTTGVLWKKPMQRL